MKLFTTYNRINLAATIAIFLLSGVTFYYAIQYIFINQIDDDLKIEQNEIETYVKEHNRLPEPVPVRDQQINYTVASHPLKGSHFTNVTIYHLPQKESELYRQLLFGIQVNNQGYNVQVAKSLEDTDDLIRSILLITITTILLILMASLIMNRFVLKKLWQPFYDTLNSIESFKLDKQQKLHFSKTAIDEFSFMNKTLETATHQAQHDYLILKEFTENASHEMQTPLAIIRSKLDLLIQSENLSGYQSKALQSSYEAVQKLSRLNQSLLLLAKIENNQFQQTKAINLQEKIKEKTDTFQELWDAENIVITAELQNVAVKMNPELCDILLNNLLSNATRHNHQNGTIYIELHPNKLLVSNTGSPYSLDTSRLFTRFYKSSGTAVNNGLGLSIIKQICDASGFNLSYQFSNQLHGFTIAW